MTIIKGSGMIDGTDEHDTIIGDKDGLTSDVIRGFKGDDEIRAYGEDDELRGGAGNDLLTGGDGSDTLWGGDGRDTFNLATDIPGVDQIMDFEPGKDKIVIADYGNPGGIFPDWELETGGMNAADKKITTVIYNDSNGKLFLDRDGRGDEKASLIAVMNEGLKVSDADFFVIG